VVLLATLFAMEAERGGGDKPHSIFFSQKPV
jgi:hypothetical protein